MKYLSLIILLLFISCAKPQPIVEPIKEEVKIKTETIYVSGFKYNLECFEVDINDKKEWFCTVNLLDLAGLIKKLNICIEKKMLCI